MKQKLKFNSEILTNIPLNKVKNYKTTFVSETRSPSKSNRLLLVERRTRPRHFYENSSNLSQTDRQTDGQTSKQTGRDKNITSSSEEMTVNEQLSE